MIRELILIIGVLMIVSPTDTVSQEITEAMFPLTDDGFIPAWLVAGPFEQPIIGLGGIAREDVIGAKTMKPVEGTEIATVLVDGGSVRWKPQHVDREGYLDFHSSMGWVNPGRIPEKIWKSRAGYAATYIDSPVEREVLLLTGSNSHLTVYMNHEEVYSFDGNRNAVPDDDSIHLKLREGRNILVLKVGNSHQNEAIQFFDVLQWQWGLYARLVGTDSRALNDITIQLPVLQKETDYNLLSTFFFREMNKTLMQRYDLIIDNPEPGMKSGSLSFTYDGRIMSFPLTDIPFGESRHEIYLPAPEEQIATEAVLTIGESTVQKNVILKPEKRYELHLMLLSHMDIGYTHPQPVVSELQANTLDDVLALCDEFPDFKWTVETLWQVEQFEKSRPPEKMEKLMAYVREGRIALSPVYTNPYTGWVSEEELIRSFELAAEYKQRFGVGYSGAVYNDTPGFSWILPQLLKNAGVSFFVAGLNELFNDYRLQKSLPKAFHWKGADGTSVLTYRTEAYNEGQSYGMEKGMQAMQQRMWSRLRTLRAWGYDYDIVLLNSTIGDNGGVPRNQYFAAREWNEIYAYPRIVISTIADFAELYAERYGNELPTLEGDWMSTWDVFGQGEPARMIRQRQAHAQLLTAETMSTIAAVKDERLQPFTDEINGSYRSLQHFSGHGSGLEYGYGSPAENYITMQHREQYIRNAQMTSDEIVRRSLDRLARPIESFEGPGIYIFNSLSWERDAAVEVQFPKEHFSHYRVIDMVTGKPVASAQDDFRLHFVARDLPPVGYKIMRLEFIDGPDTTAGGFLNSGSNYIENEYYRIQLDESTGTVTSIVDKKFGTELIDGYSPLPFNELVSERFQKDMKFAPEASTDVRISVHDQSPARLVISVERPDYLVERTDYILRENLDRIDITHTVNLEVLERTDVFVEYGIPFPFAIEIPEYAVGVLGGYLDPSGDRLPGVEHDAFSIRRDVLLYNNDITIEWSAIDSRVIRLRELEGYGRVLIANLVNNFPENWNRHEDNKGTWEFRFSMRTRKGSSFPVKPGRFGWEINTPPAVRRSWYMSNHPTEEYIAVSGNNVILLSTGMTTEGDILLRLINTHPAEKETVTVTSDLFPSGRVSQISLLGDVEKTLDVQSRRFSITVNPNEIQTYRIQMYTANE
jgi:alpha-mannosidase